GVTTRRLSSSRKVTRHSFIIDLYDNDVHKRYYVPIGEIGERSEISFSNSELTAYSFSVEVIDEMYEITNDAALAGDGVSCPPVGISCLSRPAGVAMTWRAV